jgi:hypothetical protein
MGLGYDGVMWRSLITAWIIYGCGHPSLEAYRPAIFDRPLQSFHETVNGAARDGKKAIASLDDTRLMRYLKDYVATMNARLRSAVHQQSTDAGSTP